MNNKENALDITKINLLGIETSTHECSVALYAQGKIIERSIDAPQQHNKFILPMIDELLKQTNLSSEQIHGIAFGKGPGSFTGVRLASSVAQTIAFGVNAFLIPISTLQALAQQAWRIQRSTHVLAALDARLNQIYWGYYELDEATFCMQTGKRETVSKPEKMQKFFLNQLGKQAQCIGIGNAQEQYRDILTIKWLTGYMPQAYDVVTLALNEYKHGKSLPLNAVFQPSYLREPVMHD